MFVKIAAINAKGGYVVSIAATWFADGVGIMFIGASRTTAAPIAATSNGIGGTECNGSEGYVQYGPC